MSILSVKQRLLNCRIPRLVSRVIMVTAIGAGLTACVVHEPNYRAYGHYGSHVTVIDRQPGSGYRHRHVRSRPAVTSRSHYNARRVAPRPARRDMKSTVRPARSHTRSTARPAHPNVRSGARPQARPASDSRRTAEGRRKFRDDVRRR